MGHGRQRRLCSCVCYPGLTLRSLTLRGAWSLNTVSTIWKDVEMGRPDANCALWAQGANLYLVSDSLYLWGFLPFYQSLWQPTPVLLPGKSHGQRSIVGYSPWGRRVGHDWATSLSAFSKFFPNMLVLSQLYCGGKSGECKTLLGVQWFKGRIIN